MDKSLVSHSIEGVHVYPLKIHKDERGAVMHMLRADQPHFLRVEEVYFSLVNSQVVKGWKKHKEIYQSMVVPEGTIRMVIYDDREHSKTKGMIQIVDFGFENYVMLRMPPSVWYSFKAISSTHAIIANSITAPHDPAESEILPLDTPFIPFDWSKN